MLSAPGAERENGFTLIEVLVAFAIAAAALVPLLRLFSGGAAELARSDRAATAAIWAQSLIEDRKGEAPLVSGTEVGDLPDGFHWQRTVSIYSDNGMTLAPTMPLIPYRVILTVSWAEGRNARALTLETLLLGPPPQSSQ